MRGLVLTAISLLCTILSFPGISAEKVPPSDLIFVQQGTLPIILTAPHGGQDPIPGIPARDITNSPRAPKRYVTSSDRNSDLITQGIAKEIQALIGKDPYVVMARFQRKFIDPNRPPDIAYDSPASAPVCDYYHRSIRQFVDEIRARYSAGLLIDIHTQGKIPGSLVRGTLNGRAVTRLLARAGIDAVTGPRGLFGQLEANGFSVFPTNDIPPGGKSENGGFNGGYTVATYGSHHANGIDGVQFEFGITYRQDAEVGSTVKRAAKSVVVFYEAYLRRPAD
jgi:N-formylglutamate amidohydrolase